MAVVDVQKSFRSTAQDGTQSAAIVDFYTVVFDEGTPAEFRKTLATTAAFGSVRIPLLYERAVAAPNLYVDDKRSEALGPFLYSVSVFYKTAEVEFQPRDPFMGLPPVERPQVVSFFPVVTSEAIDRDIDGNPIVNSADEGFDPAIVEDFYDLGVRINRNQSEFPDTIYAQFYNAVNAGVFFSYAAGQVKCVNISGTQARWGEEVYWQVIFEFHVRFAAIDGIQIGWQRWIADQGFRISTGTDSDNKPTYEDITDDNGSPVAKPVFLDGNGQKLQANQPIVFRQFSTKRSLNFDDLEL